VKIVIITAGKVAHIHFQPEFNKSLLLISLAKLIFYNEVSMAIVSGILIAILKLRVLFRKRDTAMLVSSLFTRQDGIGGSR
jgi:hypothetical protein